MTTDRRCLIYRVPEHHLSDLLTRHQDRWLRVRLESYLSETGTPLPADAVLGGIQYEWESRSFALRYHHPSFLEVGDGERIPRAGTLVVDVEYRGSVRDALRRESQNLLQQLADSICPGVACSMSPGVEYIKPSAQDQQFHDLIVGRDTEVKTETAVKNHGPCGVCGKDVLHACPWWSSNPDKPGATPYHEECFHTLTPPVEPVSTHGSFLVGCKEDPLSLWQCLYTSEPGNREGWLAEAMAHARQKGHTSIEERSLDSQGRLVRSQQIPVSPVATWDNQQDIVAVLRKIHEEVTGEPPPINPPANPFYR